MAVAGSAWALVLSAPRLPHPSTRLSCIYHRCRDEGRTTTLAGAEQHCSFYRSQLKKICRKIQYKEGLSRHLYRENLCWMLMQNVNKYTKNLVSAALSEGATTNGALLAKSNQDDRCEHSQKKMRASLECIETCTSLVQALHEAAHNYHSAMERQGSLTKGPWFAKAWQGIDQNAWMKFISYQAAAHDILQAALHFIREGKLQDTSNMVQQSILRLIKPLEDSIRIHLSSRDASAEDWLRQQHPTVVPSFLSLLKNDLLLPSVDLVDQQSANRINEREINVTTVALALAIYASLLKLGSTKLSCASFSSALEEELAWLMNSLADSISINCAYIFSSSVGLEKEFLSKLGPRAAFNIIELDVAEEERVFWIELLQKLVIRALGKEGFCSNLPSNMVLEVVEQDLAVFGFFAAFGRRARILLRAQKLEIIGDSLPNFFKYLEGGCVLYYPQFATLAAYQLFIEVVSEELAWLPLFEEDCNISNIKNELDQTNIEENEIKMLFCALNACSYWVDEFIRYSERLQQAENAHAEKFLSKIHCCLDGFMSTFCHSRQIDQAKMVIINNVSFEIGGKQKRFFFRDVQSTTPKGDEIFKSLDRGGSLELEVSNWTWLQQQCKILDEADENIQASTSSFSNDAVSVSDENRELSLRCQLFQMNTQIYEYATQGAVLKEIGANGTGSLSEDIHMNAGRRSPGDLMSQSFKKLQKASTDILKGTQLLAIDVVTAVALLRKKLLGYELTERERKNLKRTMTDLAAIIPIGILMLLPVTAVGHAAILAAIQKYIPGLIPSAYASERLELLTQLEELRKLDMEVVGLVLEGAHSSMDSEEIQTSTGGQQNN